jgi:YgiT-type zinc finger domain-containing protein
MPLPPASEYGRCPCGGVYEQRFVEVRMTVAGQAILLEDVPQGACPSCGSRVYKAIRLEGIEALMDGRAVPPPRVRY